MQSEATNERPLRAVADGRTLDGIQILRGIAALMVVIHHTLEEASILFAPGALPAHWVRVGAVGVDIFFVISGFIMRHASFDQVGSEGASKVFLLRRFLRIFPLYWLCLACLLAIKSAGLYRNIELTPGLLLSSVFLLPGHTLAITVGWTLVYEMYFYFVFAACMRLRSKLTFSLCVSGAIVLVLLAARLGSGSRLNDFFRDPIVLEFLYGIGLAWLFRTRRLPGSAGPWLAVAALLMIAASYYHPATAAQETYGLEPAARYWAWGIPAALTVYASFAIPRSRNLVSRLCKQLGDSSYALYLTHGFVMTAFARLLKSERLAALFPAPLWIVAVASFCVALGILTHRLVEKPLTALLRPLHPRPANRAVLANES